MLGKLSRGLLKGQAPLLEKARTYHRRPLLKSEEFYQHPIIKKFTVKDQVDCLRRKYNLPPSDTEFLDGKCAKINFFKTNKKSVCDEISLERNEVRKVQVCTTSYTGHKVKVHCLNFEISNKQREPCRKMMKPIYDSTRFLSCCRQQVYQKHDIIKKMTVRDLWKFRRFKDPPLERKERTHCAEINVDLPQDIKWEAHRKPCARLKICSPILVSNKRKCTKIDICPVKAGTCDYSVKEDFLCERKPPPSYYPGPPKIPYRKYATVKVNIPKSNPKTQYHNGCKQRNVWKAVPLLDMIKTKEESVVNFSTTQILNNQNGSKAPPICPCIEKSNNQSCQECPKTCVEENSSKPDQIKTETANITETAESQNNKTLEEYINSKKEDKKSSIEALEESIKLKKGQAALQIAQALEKTKHSIVKEAPKEDYCPAYCPKDVKEARRKEKALCQCETCRSSRKGEATPIEQAIESTMHDIKGQNNETQVKELIMENMQCQCESCRGSKEQNQMETIQNAKDSVKEAGKNDNCPKDTPEPQQAAQCQCETCIQNAMEAAELRRQAATLAHKRKCDLDYIEKSIKYKTDKIATNIKYKAEKVVNSAKCGLDSMDQSLKYTKKKAIVAVKNVKADMKGLKCRVKSTTGEVVENVKYAVKSDIADKCQKTRHTLDKVCLTVKYHYDLAKYYKQRFEVDLFNFGERVKREISDLIDYIKSRCKGVRGKK